MEEVMDFLDLAPIARQFRFEVFCVSGGWLFDVTQFLCTVTGMWDFWILMALFVLSHLVFRSVDPGAAFFMGFVYDFDIPMQCWINKNLRPIHAQHHREYWPIFGIVTGLEFLCLLLLDEEQFGVVVTVKSTAMTALWMAKKDGAFFTSYLTNKWSKASAGGYFNGRNGNNLTNGSGVPNGMNPSAANSANPAEDPAAAAAATGDNKKDKNKTESWSPTSAQVADWNAKLKAAGYWSSEGRNAMIKKLKRRKTLADADRLLGEWITVPDDEKEDLMRKLVDGDAYSFFTDNQNMKDNNVLDAEREELFKKYVKPEPSDDAFVVPTAAAKQALANPSNLEKQAKKGVKESYKANRAEVKEKASTEKQEALRAKLDPRPLNPPPGWISEETRREIAPDPKNLDSVRKFLRDWDVPHQQAARMILALVTADSSKEAKTLVKRWAGARQSSQMQAITDGYKDGFTSRNNWWYADRRFSLTPFYTSATRLGIKRGTKIQLLRLLMEQTDEDEFFRMANDFKSSETRNPVIDAWQHLAENRFNIGGSFVLSPAMVTLLNHEMERKAIDPDRVTYRAWLDPGPRKEQIEHFARLESEVAVRDRAQDMFGEKFAKTLFREVVPFVSEMLDLLEREMHKRANHPSANRREKRWRSSDKIDKELRAFEKLVTQEAVWDRAKALFGEDFAATLVSEMASYEQSEEADASRRQVQNREADAERRRRRRIDRQANPPLSHQRTPARGSTRREPPGAYRSDEELDKEIEQERHRRVEEDRQERLYPVSSDEDDSGPPSSAPSIGNTPQRSPPLNPPPGSPAPLTPLSPTFSTGDPPQRSPVSPL